MIDRKIKITFITPCFCRGADSSETGEPEIRPASIRGQLHWWFRALGGTPQEENAIFGSVHGGAQASKVVIRVCYGNCKTISSPTLPHKSGGMAAPKKAFAAGTSFDLLVSTRLGGLPQALEDKFNRALDAWLLIGALGFRATRGGGSFSYEGQPKTPEDYQKRIKHVINGSKFEAELSEFQYATAEAARKVITDTIGGRDNPQEVDSLAKIHYPLGVIHDGRKTSPLRFRIVQFAGDDFGIVVGWDGRSEVTGNSKADLLEVITLLEQKNKEIADILKDIF